MNEPAPHRPPFNPTDSVRIALAELDRHAVCSEEIRVEAAMVGIPLPHNLRCREEQRELSRQRFSVE